MDLHLLEEITDMRPMFVHSACDEHQAALSVEDRVSHRTSRVSVVQSVA